jgi:hypothetical protein
MSRKVADLVVVRGDIAEAGNLHGTRYVFRHGIGWDTAALYASVRGIVGVY